MLYVFYHNKKWGIIAESVERDTFLQQGWIDCNLWSMLLVRNSFWLTTCVSGLGEVVKGPWCVCVLFKFDLAFMGQVRIQCVQRKWNFMWYYQSKQKQEIPVTSGQRTSSLEKSSLSFPYWMGSEWFERHPETHGDHFNFSKSSALNKVHHLRMTLKLGTHCIAKKQS